MKSDYFVEFVYHDQALRQQEQYKFLIEKYKRNKEVIERLKQEKIKEVDNLLSVIDLLETDLKEFKKLIPKPSSIKKKSKPEKKTKKPKKRLKSNKKKKLSPKKFEKKGDLKELKLGLSKIRDELERM